MWRGISLHVEILKMLNQGLKYGTVHSVFNRTINIMDQNGCMISLMTKDMDEAPISIILDMEDFKNCGTSIGEDVYFNDGKVIIGSRAIDISRATNYNLKRGIFKPQNAVFRKNLETLRYLIDFKGPEEKYSFDRMAFQMVTYRTALLKQACLQEDIKEIIAIARSLIGLGQGLTPSGDDILMGLFLVLGLKDSPMNHLDILLEKIIEEKTEDTTDISYQGLLRASRGLYRSILVDAVEALTTSESIEMIIMKVLSIGHSSGRDLLYGILTGYEILVEKENGNVNEDNY